MKTINNLLFDGLLGQNLTARTHPVGQQQVMSYTDQKVSILGSILSFMHGKPATTQNQNHRFSPLRFLCLASLFFGLRGQNATPFPSKMELSQLSETDGLVLHGERWGDLSGRSVSGGGDFNLDGWNDLFTGAPGGFGAGKVYGIFGGPSLRKNDILELSRLNGTNGVVFNGAQNGDRCGWSLFCGSDFNNDGTVDLLTGAPGTLGPGKAHLIFGGIHIGGQGDVELSNLDRKSGLTLNGKQAGDKFGWSVAGGGDLNCDGVDDLVVGAPEGAGTGEVYVVFGGTHLDDVGTLEHSSFNGTIGFVIYGEQGGDQFGYAVEIIPDINGDRCSELVISAPYATSYNDQDLAGRTYVVFGGRDLSSSGFLNISNLNGINGFMISGVEEDDLSGSSLASVPNFIGVGFHALQIGAPGAKENGKSYLILMGEHLVGINVFELSNLNGANGFVLNGGRRGDQMGFSVASAGNFDHKGLSDLVVSAPYANPSRGRSDAGEIYVLFGGFDHGKSGVFEPSTLNGTNGLEIRGVELDDRIGFALSNVGDVDGDGVTDLLMGAPYSNPSPFRIDAGKTYLLFGRKLGVPLTAPSTRVSPTQTFTDTSTSLSQPSSSRLPTISSTTHRRTTVERTSLEFSQAISRRTTSTTVSSTVQTTSPPPLNTPSLVSPTTVKSSEKTVLTTLPPLSSSLTTQPHTIHQILSTIPNEKDFTIIILSSTVAALACSLFACGIIFLRKRSQSTDPTQLHEIPSRNSLHADSEISGQATISSILAGDLDSTSDLDDHGESTEFQATQNYASTSMIQAQLARYQSVPDFLVEQENPTAVGVEPTLNYVSLTASTIAPDDYATVHIPLGTNVYSTAHIPVLPASQEDASSTHSTNLSSGHSTNLSNG